MLDCYKKSENLIEDGYKFCEKLTNIGFGLLNKYEDNPARAYIETMRLIEESNLTRSTDKVEIGYSEIEDTDSGVSTYAFGVFVKSEDSPRKILFCRRTANILGECEPYIQRLAEEREDLLNKLEKLTMFINTDKIFKKLSEEKGSLLKLQFESMLSYLNILDKRLDLENIKVRDPKITLEIQ